MGKLAAILQALAAIFSGVLTLWRERKVADAAKAQVVGQVQKEALREVQVANEARVAVDAQLERDPDSLRADDGFRRP